MKLVSVKTEKFAAISDKIKSLIERGQIAQVDSAVSEYDDFEDNPVYNLLLQAVSPYLQRDYVQTLQILDRARQAFGPEESIPNSSLYSAMLVNSQLFLPRRDRPATGKGYGFYKKNIAALREVDPVLAGEVQQAVWLEEYVLVEFWDGLHFFSMKHRALQLADEEIKQKLSEHTEKRAPITFGGAELIEELRYCLGNQHAGVHGMSRAHYLVEEDPNRIRVILHLDDFSEELRSHKLILFGGRGLDERVREVFSTLRYPRVNTILGDVELVEAKLNKTISGLYAAVPREPVRAYYQSEEFRERQREIIRGELLPRVMVCTCRWTTFLKYCASDFEKAFRQIGCQTCYVIEENDVQFLSKELHWTQIWNFKPDVIFIVTHARPSLSYIPRELPVISYMQDRCGPILELADLATHVDKKDLFICLNSVFQDILVNKSVSKEQTFIMPVPVDEEQFFPLDRNCSEACRYALEVSFVKHGHPDLATVYEGFLQTYILKTDHEKCKNGLLEIFNRLFDFCCRTDERKYEPEMVEFVFSHLASGVSNDFRHGLQQLITIFATAVHSAAWRSQFLIALDQAGIELGLYGNDWEKHSQLGHLSKGAVGRQDKLNYVYNFSRINLHISQASTMHQRLVECGLAGGFMMVADHPPENDWGAARPYYQEDKEVVFFDTKKDLIDKCRYYLSHENERLEIARNMHIRTLQERTCKVAVKKVLSEWRRLLAEYRYVAGEESPKLWR